MSLLLWNNISVSYLRKHPSYILSGNVGFHLYVYSLLGDKLNSDDRLDREVRQQNNKAIWILWIYERHYIKNHI